MLPNFTYQIEDNNTVKIYDGIQNDGPLIIQPTYPNGDQFENKEAAETWAIEWIENWHAQKELAEQEIAKKEEVKSLLALQGYTEEEIQNLLR
jgi:hypothetical protein